MLQLVYSLNQKDITPENNDSLQLLCGVGRGRSGADKEETWQKTKAKEIRFLRERAIRSPYKERKSHGFLYSGYLIYAILCISV